MLGRLLHRTKKGAKPDLPHIPQELLEQVDEIEKLLTELIVEYETLQRVTFQSIESSKKLQNVLNTFYKCDSTQAISDGHCDALHRIQSRINQNNASVLQSSITPILMMLKELKANDLANVQAVRQRCELMLKDCIAADGKITGQKHVKIQDANKKKLREAREERIFTFNEFEVVERELESLLVDLEAKFAFLMLGRQCGFMESQLTQNTDNVTILQDNGQEIRYLEASLEEKKAEFESNRLARLDERKRLDSMSHLELELMDRTTFFQAVEKSEPPPPLNLLRSEEVLVKDPHVLNLTFDTTIPAFMYLTTYRLILLPYVDRAPASDLANMTIEIPLMTIAKMDVIEHNAKNHDLISFFCKDLRIVTISLQHTKLKTDNFSYYIQPYLTSHQSAFAFLYQPSPNDLYPTPVDGWSIYDPIGEFKRMGLPNNLWKLSSINHNYEFSPTYPSVLVMPIGLTDAQLEKAAKYRTKCRVPTLVWKHPDRLGVLMRSSQPKVGVKRNRCSEDEKFLNLVGARSENQSLSAPASMRGFSAVEIMDCRPRVNAIGNVAKGGGFEDPGHYDKASFSFLDIMNIHVMRESLDRLRTSFSVLPRFKATRAGSTDGLDWKHRYDGIIAGLRRGELGGWFRHLSLILKAANQVKIAIHSKGSSVLVHCSDGWDRTPQVCALAQLLLDHYYRTIHGFIVLVEKEFCSFGHRFARRTGHGDKRDDFRDSQRSPVFLQWLDAVFQLMKQYPKAFEFNARFLVEIADQMFGCKYGTFLCDNECERRDPLRPVVGKTTSLWTDLLAQPMFEQFLNTSFSANQGALTALDAIEALELWLPFYRRWDSGCSYLDLDFDLNSLMPGRGSTSATVTPKRHKRTASLLSADLRNRATSAPASNEKSRSSGSTSSTSTPTDTLDFPKAFTPNARHHSNSTPPLSLRISGGMGESQHLFPPPSPTSSSTSSFGSTGSSNNTAKGARLHLTRTRQLGNVASSPRSNGSSSSGGGFSSSPPFGAVNNSSPASPAGTLPRKMPPPPTGPRTLPRTQTMPRSPPPSSSMRRLNKPPGDASGLSPPSPHTSPPHRSFNAQGGRGRISPTPTPQRGGLLPPPPRPGANSVSNTPPRSNSGSSAAAAAGGGMAPLNLRQMPRRSMTATNGKPPLPPNKPVPRNLPTPSTTAAHNPISPPPTGPPSGGLPKLPPKPPMGVPSDSTDVSAIELPPPTNALQRPRSYSHSQKNAGHKRGSVSWAPMSPPAFSPATDHGSGPGGGGSPPATVGRPNSGPPPGPPPSRRLMPGRPPPSRGLPPPRNPLSGSHTKSRSTGQPPPPSRRYGK